MLRILLFSLLALSINAQDMTLSQDSFFVDIGGYVDYGELVVTNNTSDQMELAVGLELICREDVDPAKVQICLGTICYGNVNVDTIFGMTNTFPHGEIEPNSTFDQLKVSTFFHTKYGSEWNLRVYNRLDTTVNAAFKFKIEDCGLVSIEELYEDLDFKMGPNPVQDRMFLDFSNTPLPVLKTQIFSINGERLISKAINEEQLELNLESLASGVYLISVHTDEGVNYRKFYKS